MLLWNLEAPIMVPVKRGVILFAHGARDPRWSEPFERLREAVAERSAPTPVALAYLEHLPPDLEGAAAALARDGVETIRIVPLFFGRGGHLREDFPRLVSSVKLAHPELRFELTQAAGEDDAVIAALARFSLETPAEPL
jgi:sirohydrochlorin cobaltochelatase